MVTIALDGSTPPLVRGSTALAGLLAVIVGLSLLANRPDRPRSPDPTAVELLGLMRQRLAVMPAVAKWKWTHGKPVTYANREAALLADLRARGERAGLDPAFTEAFFTAQFDAAKQIQADDFRRWKAEGRGPFADAPDLATELRPRIDELNTALIAALSRVSTDTATDFRRRADRVMVGPGITSAVRATAIGPLLAE